MSHPITSQRKALLIYSLVWVMIALINTIILRFNLGFSILVSVAEAVTSSLLFGLFGLII